MARILYIIRGPSGTGKSTIAQHISEQIVAETTPHELNRCIEYGNLPPVIEADDFWGPNYAFNPEFIGDAHKWCQLNVKREMIAGSKHIIVSNTSIKNRDMKAYIDMAEQFGYEVDIIRTPGPWSVEDSNTRNVHGVPLFALEKQHGGYQEHPNEREWNDRSIFV